MSNQPSGTFKVACLLTLASSEIQPLQAKFNPSQYLSSFAKIEIWQVHLKCMLAHSVIPMSSWKKLFHTQFGEYMQGGCVGRFNYILRAIFK